MIYIHKISGRNSPYKKSFMATNSLQELFARLYLTFVTANFFFTAIVRRFTFNSALKV